MTQSLENRTNAMVPYFFLGPLLLLAKKGTPLADPFVQNHAKRATLFLALSLATLVAYFFLRPLFSFSLFGIYGASLILSVIIALTLLLLLFGMYQAFRGIEASSFLSWKTPTQSAHLIHSEYSEEEKIQIVASFIPFVGIILANKYKTPEVKIGAKMGNLFLVIMALTQILVGSINSATFFVSIAYIAFFAANAVYIFGFSSFFTHKFYDFIPSYHQLEAHLRAGVRYTIEFFRVAFGGEKKFSYRAHFQKIHSELSQEVAPKIPFWTHPRIIAFPCVNLITLPSLRNKKYSEYKNASIEGLFLTLLFVLEVYFYGVSHPYFLLLCIPMVTLFARISHTVNIHAPITSLFLLVSKVGKKASKNVAEIKNQEKTETFTYKK